MKIASSYRESTVLESYYDHCLPWSYFGKSVSAKEKSAEQRGTESSVAISVTNCDLPPALIS